MRFLPVAVCLACLAVLGVARVARADANEALAQDAFSEGRQHFDAGELEPALAEFRRSLQLYDSPNTRLFIGRALRELGRFDEALVELRLAAQFAEAAASTNPRYVQTASTARDEAAQLEPRVAWLVVRVETAAPLPHDTHVTVAGRDVAAAALGMRLPVLPGEVAVAVDAEGFAPFRSTVTVAAGESATVVATLVPLAPRAPPRVAAARIAHAVPASSDPGAGWRIAGITTLAFAAIGVGTFVVSGLLASGKFDELERMCGTAPCPPSLATDVQGGRTLELVANVGLVAGAILAAVGLTFVIVALTQSGPSRETQVALRVGPLGAALTGAF